jgi:hypothetical protein
MTAEGVLNRENQVGAARAVTDLAARAAGNPDLALRTWVLSTEPLMADGESVGPRTPVRISRRRLARNSTASAVKSKKSIARAECSSSHWN